MKNRTFVRYWLFSLIGVFAASFYPLYMGISVVSDMIRYGTVYANNYPKYIIPYTPIAIAMIIGVALIPLFEKVFRKYAFLAGSAVSAGVFFSAEMILENSVTVTTEHTLNSAFATLEDWQMYMCYTSPRQFEDRTWTEVNVLMGEYSPAFKLHFYLISIMILLSFMNCFYGFARMIQSKDKSRQRSLIIQSATALSFLGMCIWACFTAFYRDGHILVSTVSAALMIVFFTLLGVTAGVFASSFLQRHKAGLSIALPSCIASLITLLMYIGEMVLLSGHLYRFGNSFLFRGLPGIVLAPVDIAVILLSGGITALISFLVRPKETLNAEDNRIQ